MRVQRASEAVVVDSGTALRRGECRLEGLEKPGAVEKGVVVPKSPLRAGVVVDAPKRPTVAGVEVDAPKGPPGRGVLKAPYEGAEADVPKMLWPVVLADSPNRPGVGAGVDVPKSPPEGAGRPEQVVSPPPKRPPVAPAEG
jgi:hypothetical protein